MRTFWRCSLRWLRRIWEGHERRTGPYDFRYT